ncbi:GatB/YqeY domain-containing protein [Croceimicrobium hydrocarbonivorans]|uniref:GatB/YqeY domain-containing protein n=1 Tax=Croceimicrobium hydrocarbonivorans TaxID=2761580 RepID=A0A7H0VI30_9FLAO|nr:GatB/YqeY domain-containing protein [Croceimicrobium hydrocarbonivorans]QNR25378.1 GatB/YqeY domain-containing protein [Croceimicrobium hydrocarbonivorans]
MSLIKNIAEEIKTAMKAKDKVRLESLRSIKSAIMLAQTEKGAGAELNEEEELKILTRLQKQRKDSLAIYEEQNREDLASEERAQLEVIEEFLPKALSPEELEDYLKKLIAEVGAAGPQDMGKVMGRASKDLAGRADGKSISAKVKELLAN